MRAQAGAPYNKSDEMRIAIIGFLAERKKGPSQKAKLA